MGWPTKLKILVFRPSDILLALGSPIRVASDTFQILGEEHTRNPSPCRHLNVPSWSYTSKNISFVVSITLIIYIGSYYCPKIWIHYGYLAETNFENSTMLTYIMSVLLKRNLRWCELTMIELKIIGKINIKNTRAVYDELLQSVVGKCSELSLPLNVVFDTLFTYSNVNRQSKCAGLCKFFIFSSGTFTYNNVNS